MREGLGRWAYARALLITLVLFSQCVAAIPAERLSRRMRARPEGQRVVRWIGGAIAWTGAEPTPARIERWLLRTSRSIVRARNAALTPVKPLLELTGSRQRWFLFTSAGEVTHRLRIEAREAASGTWRMLYRAHVEDRLGLHPALSYRRVRGVYNPKAWTGVVRQYKGFANWIASDVLRSHPEYEAVRVGMERLELATRDRANRELGIEHVVERTREQLR